MHLSFIAGPFRAAAKNNLCRDAAVDLSASLLPCIGIGAVISCIMKSGVADGAASSFRNTPSVYPGDTAPGSKSLDTSASHRPQMAKNISGDSSSVSRLSREHQLIICSSAESSSIFEQMNWWAVHDPPTSAGSLQYKEFLIALPHFGPGSRRGQSFFPHR